MEEYKEEDLAFEIILHSGNAKSLCMEALEASREKDFEKMDRLFIEASEELRLAHACQTDVLRKSLINSEVKIGMLMIHAQDHVMNAITINDLTKEIARLSRDRENNK